MAIIGTVSSQIRKYAGYTGAGFAANASWTSTDATNDTKVSGTPFINATTYEKILFISDTNSTLPITITNPMRATAGYANKSVAGYTVGGETAAGAATTRIDKLLFSNETHSSLSTTLAAVVFAFHGAANDNVAGYTFGGYGASAPINTINKLTFSNETNAAIAAVLPEARHSSCVVSNGPTAIYNAGGTLSTGATTNQLRKLTLSNESMSSLATTLSQTTFQQRPGVSNVGTTGYFTFYYAAGGTGAGTNALVNSCDKLTYSNETRSNISSGAVALASYWCGGYANSNIAGYVCGGEAYDASARDTTTRINRKFPFSTETFFNINSNMTTWRRQTQGFAHSL